MNQTIKTLCDADASRGKNDRDNWTLEQIIFSALCFVIDGLPAKDDNIKRLEEEIAADDRLRDACRGG